MIKKDQNQINEDLFCGWKHIQFNKEVESKPNELIVNHVVAASSYSRQIKIKSYTQPNVSQQEVL